jgi:hypothetical protein
MGLKFTFVLILGIIFLSFAFVNGFTPQTIEDNTLRECSRTTKEGIIVLLENTTAMQASGKFSSIKSGVTQLINKLHPTDMFGVVSYNNFAATVILPGVVQQKKAEMVQAVSDISAQGNSRHLKDGLRRAKDHIVAATSGHEDYLWTVIIVAGNTPFPANQDAKSIMQNTITGSGIRVVAVVVNDIPIVRDALSQITSNLVVLRDTDNPNTVFTSAVASSICRD